jgi:hypothetical protein
MGHKRKLRTRCNIGEINVTVVRDVPGAFEDKLEHSVTVVKINGEKPSKNTVCDKVLVFSSMGEGDYEISVTPNAESLYAFADPPVESHLNRGGKAAVTLTIKRLQVTSLDIPPRDDVSQKLKDALINDPNYATIPLWKQYINVELTQEAKDADATLTDAKKNQVLNAAGPDVPKQDVVDATLEGTPGRERADAIGAGTIPLAEAKRMVADGALQLRSHKMHEERADAAKKLAEDEKTRADADAATAKTNYDNDHTNDAKKKLWEKAKAKADKAQKELDAANARKAAAPDLEMDPRSFGRDLEFEAKLNEKVKGVKVYFDLIRTDPGPNGNYPWINGANDERGAALKEKMTPFDALNGNLANKTAVTTDDQGACKASFRLSRVGGDKYTVVAGLKKEPGKFAVADFTDGLGKKSRFVQVWRKIWYQLTYTQNSGVPPRTLAQADFEKLFIVAEEECETAYDPADIAGLATTEKWQFDNSIPKGTLYPGKSASVTVELVSAEAEKLGSKSTKDLVKFKDNTDADPLKHVTIQRRAEVVAEGELEVTAGDWEPEMNRGNPAGVAKKEYTLKNIGGRTINYVVENAKDWLALDTLGGSLSPGSQTTLAVRLNEKADVLAAGSPSDTDTLKFTNSATHAGPERQVKLKVTGDGNAGKLEVRPTNGFTTLGAVGAAFAPAQSPAYTIKNAGSGSMRYRISTGKAWLKLGGPAWDRMAAQVQKQKDTAEKNKQKLENDRLAAVDNKNRADQQLQNPSTPSVKRIIIQMDKAIAEATIKQIDNKLKLLSEFLTEAPKRLDGAVLEGALAQNATDSVVLNIKSDKVTALESDTVKFTNLKETKETGRTVTLAQSPELKVEANDWAPAGFKAGGQDAPVTKEYEIENLGGAELKFSASKGKDWILLDVTSGALAPGAKRKVRIETTEKANTLDPGNQVDTVEFKNDTNNKGTAPRAVTLDIKDPGTKLQVSTGAFSVLGTYDAGTSKMKGVFDPLSIQYSIKNTGNARIQYEVSKAAAWLRITSDDPQVSVGGDNRVILRKLLEQPATERPKTAHLIMCDRQWDPTESVVMTFDQEKQTDWFNVKNSDGRILGAFLPPLQGGPFFVNGFANKWKWDGHEGPLTDNMVTLDRDRTHTSRFNITLPERCPVGCPKPGCGGNTAINPSVGHKAEIDFKINGAKGPYLGEGGKEGSPHALIVLEDTGKAQRDENSINDTISHEVGHMYHQVQHNKAEAQTYLQQIKDNWAQWGANIKSYYEFVKKDFEYYYEDGTPDHAYQYTGRGGQGSHCAKGAVKGNACQEYDYQWPINTLAGKGTKSAAKVWNTGSCILYASGRDVKLNWCEDCKKVWKYIDLKRFTYT